VHTSLVEPLPHQIAAVYEAMLPRQPLRFLLADDPGAGKTIMSGLLIKELVARGYLQRCLIVCPGSLAEQWQDELYQRFALPFEILTNDKLEAARTGNWFLENNLVIARLDNPRAVPVERIPSRRVEERLRAEHGASAAGGLECERVSRRGDAGKLLLKPRADVLLDEHIQGEFSGGKLLQVFRTEIGYHKPVRHVDAELIAAKAARCVAGKARAESRSGPS